MSFPSNTHPSPPGDQSAGHTPADLLRAAAQYLGRHGWTQGRLYADLHSPSPKACALGAIAIATHGDPDPEPVDHNSSNDCTNTVDAFEDYLTTHSGYHDIGRWNDNPHRTAAQVIAALNDAANQLDRAHH